MAKAFEVTPRAPELGGGWNVKFFEDGEEVGGAVHPLAAYQDAEDPERAAHLAALEDGEEFTW